MPNSRTILISLDHLASEIAAYPLVAPDSLKCGLFELDPLLLDSTGTLWRDAERYLTSRFPHTSIDELVALRNLYWFNETTRSAEFTSVTLCDYVASLASSYLVWRGPHAEPHLPEAKHGRGGIDSCEAPEPAARRAWRWLTLAMPGDLILAGLRSNQRRPLRVDVLSPAVTALLNGGGYAETHLHAGIAFDFSMAWAAAVNMVGRGASARGSMEWDAFHNPGAEHGEGEFLASWLVRGAICRYLLAEFLRLRHPNELLDDFLEAVGEGSIGNSDRRWHPLSQRHRDAIREAVIDVFRGSLGCTDGVRDPRMAAKQSFLRMQAAYSALTSVTLQRFPRVLDMVQRLDPLSDFYAVHVHGGPSVQAQFLWDGFEQCRRHATDRGFARMFWQIERVRCQLYRHCIQRPLTPGLTNFIRFYDRKKPFSRALDDVIIESAGTLAGVGEGLRSLEIRTSPTSNRDDQRSQIASMRAVWLRLQGCGQPLQGAREQLASTGAWQVTECGLVLHFLKSRGKAADKGRPAAGDAGNFADPDCGLNTLHYRWQRYFLDRRREARAIANAIKLEPELLGFLRGIDVCRDEPGVPTWVIAPLFEEVRGRINLIRSEFYHERGTELPPLRTTVHVGEDFVHLASGVRLMDEAVRFLPLVSGDRVGHGLALGVDAVEWARRSTRLAMPREDRWFDLIWERHWHTDPDARFSNARRAFIEDEIVRLALEMFNTSEAEYWHWTVQRAIEFVCHLHDIRRLRSLGFPDHGLTRDAPKGAAHFLERYLHCSAVYRRCRTVEWVESGRDGEAVAELQRLVRRKYADIGITIEVNPISNLMVGDLGDLESHPLWRLAPNLDHQGESSVRMCIGSDDPFPFATNLREEYQFLFDALVLAGKSQADARNWLDAIRQMGLESRFTLPN